MRKIIAVLVTLTLILSTVSRGADSPEGGKVGKGEGFKIDVPTLDTKVKQGETKSVTISLKRGAAFKQDVKLEIEVVKGISVEPDKVTVKASDKPDVRLMITAPENAAVGEYKVSVKGTPATGEPTSAEFKVKVVAPEAGLALKSESPKGGGTGKGEEFKIAVPALETKVKQGETRSIIISLKRGEAFKQDVTLEIKLSEGEGLTFDPVKVVVKASDEPEVQLKITAPKDAAIGEYKVSVKGTPATGEPTSVEFKVKVVAL